MAYQQMAYLYDRLMEHAPYDQWLDFTEKVFRLSEKEINKVADLGCGTGEITMRLAGKGYDMTGVDYSEDMLTYAEHKTSRSNPIHWVCQDLRDLEGHGDYDAAVSYCDVINYITDPQDLREAFGNIAAMLADGGLFLFDVHSLSYVENVLVDNTFADVMEDASYIWFCSEGDHPGEMHHDLTFFAAADGSNYERFDEYHHQRTFSIEFFKKLLADSGFENIKVQGDFLEKYGNDLEEADRIFFIAEKRPG
ncbi:class I SAM-dependent DNA methyltransferase [Virgibacillus xinjiangensis]|uniref:Class I SAM-dependent DNA methyltransferase n=1 Tax=Virgibacillus xinjiangensis TaxID=393090 RepID=A0ABV7CRV5_9BACI